VGILVSRMSPSSLLTWVMALVVALVSVTILLASTPASASMVTFDGRSFMIDGQRQLFVGGSIHYPRAPRSEWRTILSEAKASGINLVRK
jgi:hypothetical protein